jgi:tripartite-type tricarboxylate transporter receptor subunit TctC
VLGGHIDALFQSPIAAAKQIAAGKLRPLAVTAELPDVPTFAEVGYPGVVVHPFDCLLAPAHTPPEIVNRLNAAVNKVLQMEDAHQKLAELGFDIGGGSPDALMQFLGRERERWGRVIREAKITAE